MNRLVNERYLRILFILTITKPLILPPLISMLGHYCLDGQTAKMNNKQTECSGLEGFCQGSLSMRPMTCGVSQSLCWGLSSLSVGHNLRPGDVEHICQFSRYHNKVVCSSYVKWQGANHVNLGSLEEDSNRKLLKLDTFDQEIQGGVYIPLLRACWIPCTFQYKMSISSSNFVQMQEHILCEKRLKYVGLFSLGWDGFKRNSNKV